MTQPTPSKPSFWKYAAKALSATVAAATAIVSSGVFHGTAAHVVSVIALVAGVLAVYFVPNAKTS